MNKLYNIDSVSFSYIGGRPILSDFSVAVQAGKVLGMMGASGCGKSTLLKLMAGILTPSSGKIEYLAPENPPRIGYCPQSTNLLPWRNSIENILLGCDIFGQHKGKSKERALELLDLFGLSNFQNMYPHQLSGGMRKRIAILRTLAMKPDILFLDEPFSSIDLVNKLGVLRMISTEIDERGIGCVIISHDPLDLGLLADDVTLLSGPELRIERSIRIKQDRVFRIENWPNDSKTNWGITNLIEEIKNIEN